MRGLDRAEAMLAALVVAVPRLGVDRQRCAAALEGGALATDEVMRRVEQGGRSGPRTARWRRRSRRGETFVAPTAARIVARRRSTGGLGNLGLERAPRPGCEARGGGARASEAGSTAPSPGSPGRKSRR